MRCLIILLLTATLVACERNSSMVFLLEHPSRLKTEIMRCQSSMDSKIDNKYCDQVIKTARALLPLVNSQQADPEKFGEAIMQAELLMVQAKQEVNRVASELKQTQNKTSPEAVAEQEKLKDLQQKYDELQMQVKILLAVAGLNTPD